MTEVVDSFESAGKPDVRETPGGFEMKVQLQSPDVLFDPANIVFVVLPKVWREGEYMEKYGSSSVEKVKDLIDSGVPFVPGIKPYSAWVHVFNPLELKTGSGVLSYDKGEGSWKEGDTGRLRMRSPNTSVEVLARRLGMEEKPLTDEELTQRLTELSDDEVERRIFDRVLSCLPRIVTRGNFERDPDLKKEVVRLLLTMHQINESPDEMSNRDMGVVYDKLKEVFSNNMPSNQLYRHDRPMLVSGYEMDPEDSNRGILVLV